MKCLKPLRSSLLLLVPIIVVAQEVVEDVPSVGKLILEPRLCILAQQDENCKSNINVRWQLSLLKNVCLRTDLNLGDIDCWIEANAGEAEVSISTGKNILFELIDSINGERLLSEEFRVIRETEKRRRKRRPWSYF